MSVESPWKCTAEPLICFPSGLGPSVLFSAIRVPGTTGPVPVLLSGLVLLRVTWPTVWTGGDYVSWRWSLSLDLWLLLVLSVASTLQHLINKLSGWEWVEPSGWPGEEFKRALGILSVDKIVFLRIFQGASLMAQTVKNPPAMQKIWVRSLGQEDPPEKGMATHSSILVFLDSIFK